MTPVVFPTHTLSHTQKERGKYTHTNRQIWKILYCCAICIFQIYTIVKPHATWKCTHWSFPFLDFSHFSLCNYKPFKIPTKLKHGWWSCNVTWQFDCSTHVFTVDMWLISLLGQLEKTEYRSFNILHAEDPERVLLGSLQESDNHSAACNWLAYLWAGQFICPQNVGHRVCRWTSAGMTNYCQIEFCIVKFLKIQNKKSPNKLNHFTALKKYYFY